MDSRHEASPIYPPPSDEVYMVKADEKSYNLQAKVEYNAFNSKYFDSNFKSTIHTFQTQRRMCFTHDEIAG